MLESITITKESTAPPAQARLPAEREISQKEEDRRVEKQAPELSDMTEMVADAQNNLNMMHDVNLQFSVHELSGKMMVTVKDGSTGDVIREIPPSDILNLVARLEEMVGLLFDQKG